MKQIRNSQPIICRGQEAYPGIDMFRMPAAFFIIAIHTSPLSSYSEMGDFILTRIIARVGVPFFFLTSGFFLLSGGHHDNSRLAGFVRKSAWIYGLSILLYLPLNIYNGYFTMDYLLPNILKDIVFDGTLYHLWYLPASILGGIIAWYAVGKMGYAGSLLLALLLYIIGLFGDSYYGIAEQLPVLKGMYQALFEVSDYTRNGVFFAPLFFVLGGLLGEPAYRSRLKYSIPGFAGSLLLMLGEALLLHRLGLQRHDSMYLMLPVCMYFLFSILLHLRGRRSPALRNQALIIYIIHPMMIVVIRMLARLTHTRELLVDNSLVHFLAVSLLSGGFAAVLSLYHRKHGSSVAAGHRQHGNSVAAGHRQHGSKPQTGNGRAWIELDLQNLRHNAGVLQEVMPAGCELMAVVKADAYGHGALAVASCLNEVGVKAFGVATIEEGIALRRQGIRGEILILGYTSPERAGELHRYHLMQTLIDFDYALQLNRQGYHIQAHMKIDTGMHRLGFDSGNVEKAAQTFSLKYIEVCGIYTHLCVSDSPAPEDVAFTRRQIENFYLLIDELKAEGIRVPKTHIQSSYGLLNYPDLHCDYARIGIALYGVLSAPGDTTVLQPDLRPVLSLKTRVILIRQIGKGESVGYGRSFLAARDSIIAILPIGYGDGIPRTLSNENGRILLRGEYAPIVGRICMDQLAVDVTDIVNVRVGDMATLIGLDGQKELSAPSVADSSHSISNELLCRLGTRLHT